MGKEVEQIQEEFNLDKKVTVKSIAGWETGFARIETTGDVRIMPEGTIKLTRSEIIAQTQKPNLLFNGIDGKGSHATYYIDDAETREYLDFESEGNKQNIFSDELAKKIFAITSQKKFEEEFISAIRTRAEKYAVMSAIKRLKINDYSKIRFAENYTGYRYDN